MCEVLRSEPARNRYAINVCFDFVTRCRFKLIPTSGLGLPQAIEID